MESEVNVWKAKLVDAMRKADKLGSAENVKLLPNVEDLHMLLEEMSNQVENSKTQCHSDWSPIKKVIEIGTVDMHGKYEESMEHIGHAALVSIPG